MKINAIVAVLIALTMLLCVLPAASGERDSLYIQISLDKDGYEVGDTIQLTVQVFDKGVPANADDVNVSFQTEHYGEVKYLDPSSSSTGVYTASHLVVDGEHYFMGDVNVQSGTDHEGREFWMWIDDEDLTVRVSFDGQDSIAVAPGEVVTATITVRYKGNLVDADQFNELFIRDPDDNETDLTEQRISTGTYTVTYTMPSATEDGEYELVAVADYANAHSDAHARVNLYMLSVWYSQISVAGNTLSCQIGVATPDGAAVPSAEVVVFRDQDDMTGTTDSNGTVIFNIPDVWNGMDIEGEVSSGGKTQSFETEVSLPDDDPNPHHNYFDVLFAGEDDNKMFSTGSQLARKYRAFNDTIPLQSQDIYYYIHFAQSDTLVFGFRDAHDDELLTNSEVIAQGVATTNSLGEFTVTVTAPSQAGALAYVFEAGMPKQPQNYHTNHHSDFDEDDDLVYEQGNGWYRDITDVVGVVNNNRLSEDDIKITTNDVKVGSPTKVTVDFGRDMGDVDNLFAAWLPGDYEDISDAFEPGNVPAWEEAGSTDGNILLKATDTTGVYEGEAVIPEFMGDQEKFTIAAGYMDEDGNMYLNSVALAEGESADEDAGFLGLGPLGLPLLLLLVIVMILVLVMVTRKKPSAPAGMPSDASDEPEPAFPEGVVEEPEPEFPSDTEPETINGDGQ
jgi:hypothetical protein